MCEVNFAGPPDSGMFCPRWERGPLRERLSTWGDIPTEKPASETWHGPPTSRCAFPGDKENTDHTR